MASHRPADAAVDPRGHVCCAQAGWRLASCAAAWPARVRKSERKAGVRAFPFLNFVREKIRLFFGMEVEFWAHPREMHAVIRDRVNGRRRKRKRPVGGGGEFFFKKTPHFLTLSFKCGFTRFEMPRGGAPSRIE